MPDSFTKFKEDPPAQRTSANGGSTGSGGSSGSGSGSGSGATATPTPTTPPSYIQVNGGKSTFIYYPDFDLGFDDNGDDIVPDPIALETIGGTAVEGEITYAITPTTLPNGLSFNTSTGEISGNTTQFFPLTTYQITATHTPTGTTIYSSVAATPLSIQLGSFSIVKNFAFPQGVGQSLIIEIVRETTPADIDPITGVVETEAIYDPYGDAILEDFPLGTIISNKDGTTAVVRWYDLNTSALYVEVTANPSGVAFDIFETNGEVKGSIDNSATFATSRAYVEKVTYAFETAAANTGVLPSVPAAFTPTLYPTTLNASTELADWITWSISPTLPSPGIGALTMDTGTIGSLVAAGGFGGNGTISGYLSNTGESLLPTDYSISVQSGPADTNALRNVPIGEEGKLTTVKTVGISILDYALPKRLSSIDYRVPASTKMVIAVSTTDPFTQNGKVSNAHGFLANVDAVDATSNLLYVTTDASVNPYGYIGTETDARRMLDNAATYFSDEATVTDVYYVYPASTATSLSLTPDSNVLSSVEGELSGTISYTNGSAVVTGFQTQFNKELIAGANAIIIIAGNPYTISSITSATSLTLASVVTTATASAQPYKASLIDQTSERGTHTYQISPNPGTILGSGFTFLNSDATNPGQMTVSPVSGTFPQITFTVQATDLLGRTVSKNLRFGSFTPPKGLATTNSFLLNVPSASYFSAGDFISSSSGGSGIVLDKFTVSSMNDYIKIKVFKGDFPEFDDLDNKETFQAQRTYIYDSGVIPFNAELALSNTTNFSATVGVNDIWVGGGSYDASTTRGVIKFINGLNVYTLVEQGSFLDSGAQTAQSDAGGSATITNLEANNVILNGVSNVAAAEAGKDIGSNNGAVGTINSVDGSNLYVSHLSAPQTFADGAGNEVEYVSPLTGGATFTTTSVQYDNTYYLHQNEEVAIVTSLNEGWDVASGGQNVTYSIEGAGVSKVPLPDGLSLNPLTGLINGTPTEAFPRTLYTLTARTSSGSVTTNFYIQVYDSFEIRVSETNKPFSYIFHRGAQGMGRAPCRVRRDQIENGNVVDLTCYLEAGQLDLWQQGVNLKVSTGDDLCQYIVEKPYGFHELPPLQTSSSYTVTENTGSFGDTLCSERYNASATINRFPINDSLALSEQITAPSDMCLGNYTTAKIRTATGINPAAGMTCDEGSLTISQNEYDTSGSACLAQACSVGAGANLTYTDCIGAAGVWNPEGATFDQTNCENNFGTCATCDGGGCGALTTRAACEGDNGTWTANSGIFGPYCTRTLAANTSLEECGGNSGSCVRGPQDDRFDIGIQGRAQEITLKDNGTDQDITYVAPSSVTSYLGFAADTNKYLASYSNTSQCASAATYAYDFANLDTYANSTTYNDPLRGGQPFYEIRCVDGSFNTKARVRFHIRDWNSGFSAGSNIDRSDPAAVAMDLSGLDAFGIEYDSRYDLDVATAASPRSFASCGVPNADLALTGTVTIDEGSQIVVGAGTLFTTELEVGATITISGTSYTVASIASNTSLRILQKAVATGAGLAVTAARGFGFPASGF
tara:strand:- start:82365 stop:87011 length:4647 start_codon:yes stop_codon:yes gene_type:complete